MSEFDINEIESTESEEIEEISAEEEEYRDTGSVSASILGGLVGMIAALLICTLVYGITGKMPFILFFLFPFCICLMSILFGGSLSLGGIISETVFTFLGIFIFPAFRTACDQVLVAGTSPFSIPLVALTQIGESSFFSGFSLSSLYVFPILIAIIGIAISWQIFKLKKAKSAS